MLFRSRAYRRAALGASNIGQTGPAALSLSPHCTSISSLVFLSFSTHGSHTPHSAPPVLGSPPFARVSTNGSPQHPLTGSRIMSLSAPLPVPASHHDTMTATHPPHAAFAPVRHQNNDSVGASAAAAGTSENPLIPKRRRRTSPAELALLEDEFRSNPLPTQAERARLAGRVSMTGRALQVWFQNRR